MRPIVIALAFMSFCAPAFAHHNANAEYQMESEKPVIGVLKQVRDISPHAIWFVDVTDASGETSTWHFEAVSTNALRRQGVMVKKDIRPGQTYTFYVAPTRDGSAGGFLTGIEINGQKIQIVRG